MTLTGLTNVRLTYLVQQSDKLGLKSEVRQTVALAPHVDSLIITGLVNTVTLLRDKTEYILAQCFLTGIPLVRSHTDEELTRR